MTLYQVQGTITRTENGEHSTRQIPTFYLDSAVQGIMSVDHARRVAGDVVSTIAGPVRLGFAWSYDLAVTEVTPPAAPTRDCSGCEDSSYPHASFCGRASTMDAVSVLRRTRPDDVRAFPV